MSNGLGSLLALLNIAFPTRRLICLTSNCAWPPCSLPGLNIRKDNTPCVGAKSQATTVSLVYDPMPHSLEETPSSSSAAALVIQLFPVSSTSTRYTILAPSFHIFVTMV